MKKFMFFKTIKHYWIIKILQTLDQLDKNNTQVLLEKSFNFNYTEYPFSAPMTKSYLWKVSIKLGMALHA